MTLRRQIDGKDLPRDPKSRRMYRRRVDLFHVQGGLCFWCAKPMSLESMVPNIHGRPKQNLLYASFEHLIPKSRGGIAGLANVVLAHSQCNGKRHKKKWAHDPIYGQGGSPIIAMNWPQKAPQP